MALRKYHFYQKHPKLFIIFLSGSYSDCLAIKNDAHFLANETISGVRGLEGGGR